ncbi:capsular exopolysaccharide synthesis family protein [Anseongella ginsenosidimutans]|uniref:Capsular exopolysaccharide synthesis family protein n=1 Tax=Anseongella ginsenosidimutans TaxID=496056 RepID=A0A4R3KM77_9SPHI|nr:polysaccharide biosynthesis tyrosine autokinase [Anseongella ginsenosidimutans]QEC52126.1 polysaccharide biosynthesis tyrosine autokinase [Anseongella ginsenosidimutans]TCS84845.1 capsular exopolysaccharide synthesis family protein [Anseongella ginsenosidimutans]
MENKATNGAASNGSAPFWQNMQAEDVQINLNNLLKVLKSRWYWVLGTLLLSVVLCYLFLKVTHPEYQAEATLKYNSNEQSQVTDMSQMLFPDFMKDQQYLAEIYTLKSVSLVSKALDTMGHHFSFEAREGLRMANIYPAKPFEADVIYYNPDEFHRGTFNLNYGEEALEINYYPGAGPEQSFQLRQGDTVSVPGLQFVLNSIHGVGHSDISFSYLDFFTIKENIVNSLNISEAEKGVPVLKASFTGNNSLLTRDFLKALMLSYEEYDLELKRRSSDQTLGFINEQVGIFESLLGESSSKLEDYKKQYDFIDIQASSAEMLQSLTELNLQKNTLEIQRQNIGVLTNDIQSGEEVIGGVIGLDNSTDQVLVGMVGQLNELRAQRRQMLLNYSPESSQVKNLDEEIAGLEGRIVQSAQVQQQKNQQAIQVINSEIAKINSRLGSMPTAEKDLISLTSDVQVNQNMYSMLLNKKLESSITKAGVLPSFSVLDMPRVSKKVAPKTTMIMAVFLILGLGSGVGLIFLKRMLNNRFANLAGLNQLNGVSVLGVINHFPEDVTQSREALKELLENRSVFSETINAIRTNIAYLTQNGNKKVIALTSEVSGEGKSFVSLNIAIAMTKLGKKVLIMASDLRRSKLHRYFNNPNRVGLSTFLSNGQHDPNVIVQHSAVQGLDFITSGPVPLNPSELLYQDRFWAAIEDLKPHYDYILIDTAPIGLVSDSIPIVRRADLNIFVVRWLYSSSRSYELPLSIANEYKLNNMYIVVNDYKKDDLYSSLNDEEFSYGGYNKYYANYSAYYDNAYYENEDSWWDKLKKRVTAN